MKNKLFAIVLSLCLIIGMATPVCAYTDRQYRIAEALNELGLFLGDGTGYALDNLLGRDDGTTLLVRLLGKDKEAKDGGDFGMPFTDVPNWAKGYVGYAWKNGITNGTGATTFGSNDNMVDYMFLTLVLRALNYSDKGENPRFVWNAPYELAKEVGLITSTTPDNNFTRGEAIEVFWRALNSKYCGEDVTLSERLIEQGVFTAKAFAEAQEIQKNGRVEDTDDEEKEYESDSEENTETEKPVTPGKQEESEKPAEPGDSGNAKDPDSSADNDNESVDGDAEWGSAELD